MCELISFARTIITKIDMIPKLQFQILLLSLILILGFSKTSNAQFEEFEIFPCADSAAVVALFDSVFLGKVPGYAKKNIKFYGDPTAVGYFHGGFFLGFDSGYGKGIVMSTGHVDDIDEGNTCGGQASFNTAGVDNDPDLNLLASDPTRDGCIIEFQFKPTADSVRFNYIFGSEEYNEFTGPSDFNDAFGFLLFGDGISGIYADDAKNIAEIPGTHLPCSIKNINIGDGGSNCNSSPTGCNNCQFFIDNSQQPQSAFSKFVFDGYTVTMPAKSAVTQCQWYTIRLKLADAVDAAYDTGVFLEKGSFNLGTIEGTPSYTHPTIDSLVYESCNNNYVNMEFNMTAPLGFDYYIPYEIAGTATLGDDYQMVVNLLDTLFYPIGSTQDSIIFRNFYEDAMVEGLEDIQVIYRAEMCNPFLRDTAFVYILDKPVFEDTTIRYTSYCEDTVTLSFAEPFLTGIPPYSYSWDPGGFQSATLDYIITGTDSVEVYCIVRDTCGRQVLDTAIIISPPIYSDAGPDLDLCNVTSVQLQGSSDGAQYFHWTSDPNDPSLVGQDSITDPIVSPTVNYTEYTLKVSDNCTHVDYDIAIASLTGATANPEADNEEICIGETVELTVNPGATNETYVWTSVPVDPSLAGQENNQILNVTPTATSTVYSVVVTNDCSFTADSSITVSVNPLPNASAGIDNAVCFGQSYDLLASGGVDYVWTSIPVDLSLVGQDSINNPMVTPDTQTDYEYTVEVTDANGCVNTDFMVLQVDPIPDIVLDVPNEFMCYGESVSIEAVGNADDLTWTANPPDASLSGQQNNAIINVSPLETTTYTLVGNVAGFNCPATLEQTITVKPELFSTFELQDNITCENEAFALNYTGNAGSGATYDWDFADAFVNAGSGSGPYDIQWDVAGTKTVSLLVTEDGCPAEPFSLDLNVISTPIADFTSDIISGCTPLSIEFSSTSTNTTNNVTYTWDLGNGNNGTSETISTTYGTPGEYDISFTITNEGRCSNAKNVDSYIDANETPVADFNPVPPESILEDDQATIEFENTSVSGDALTYNWDFGDGTTGSTQQSPSHIYTAPDIYIITLSIITGNGCESYSEKEVTIHPDFVVYAPNAFSPNGDGKNDLFEIKGIGLKTFHLQIFSRWGELMYESNNIEDQWDGKYDGEFVPTGTYVFTINYTSMLDKDKVLEGSVTVLK